LSAGGLIPPVHYTLKPAGENSLGTHRSPSYHERMKGVPLFVVWSVSWLVACQCLSAQSTGTVSGTVYLDPAGDPMHNARVILMPLGRSVDSGDDGKYEFADVPAGSYEVVVQSPGLSGERKAVQLTAGASETVDLRMSVAAVRYSVTVTASGREEAAIDAVQPVTSLEQMDLPLRSAASLGDVLEDQAGITKRSFGPGNSRPVIRGFDGTRVMVLQDGVSTGTLSFQSGDHAEPVDVNQLERLEVVRGPATLLYGSGAIGGVVNAVSRHETHQHADPGVRGFITGLGGSNNALGGGSGGFEIGTKSWEFWASGGGQRTGDYDTPIGTIQNSQTRVAQTDAGLGRYGERALFTFDYGFTDSNYGIPINPEEEEGEVAHLEMRRHNYRVTYGWKDLGFVENVSAKLNYSDYNHNEVVQGEGVATSFFNNQFIYNVVFDQKRHGRSTGSFGFWGTHRDYKTVGEEALTPPTLQNGFAVFALQNMNFESLRLQFGGRLEHNQYNPAGLENRSFTGFSGSVGLNQRLWTNGAFAVNYSHAYRAPALEELYNHGPHEGNLTFEIGNPNLNHEQNDGLDVSLRHQSNKLHGELNFFYYRINDFIYLAPTGNIEDGLIEAEYLQHDSRFLGGEARLDLGVHPNFWINLGADTVQARLTSSGDFLPRIPPVRGHVGFDARYKGLSLRPELVLASAQNKIFPTETPTAGFGVVNLIASYTVARAHQIHLFSVSLYNAGDNLYRNHLSFIKEFAPEIGRGIRVSYTVQFF
jgi:iron complex outermembrane receptor protein